MATPVLVQSVAQTASSVTSLNVTFPSPNTAGNFLVANVAIINNAPVGISDPSNGTYFKLVDGFAGSNRLTIAITPLPSVAVNNSGQGATVAFTCGVSTTFRVVLQEWSGVDATNPMFMVDQTLGPANGTSTTPSAGTFATLAEPGELLLVWGTTGSTGVTWTAGSGYTLDPNTANGGGRMDEYQVASGTTGPAANFTISSSTAWTCCAVALRSAKTRKVISLSGTTFSAPTDWPGVADRVDLIGAGGAARSGSNSTHEPGGGGGGAYTYIYNFAIANGTAIQIGAGGATNGAAGTGSWVGSNSTLLAVGGGGATLGGSGPGGLASNCIPAANASSGGNGGTLNINATGGACGGGGAAGPYGAGANAGAQATTGTTGGTGGGGGGGGSAGAAQVNSTQAGTTGGNFGSPAGTIAATGGAGGASGTNAGTSGSSQLYSSGAGGGGGGSNGSGGGGAGATGSVGEEFALSDGTYVGSGGGGGGTGQITSGSTPLPGNGALYGAGGGGGGGQGTFSAFGTGANGLIVVTYTPSVLGAQTVSSSHGTLGDSTSYPLTQQTVTSAVGTIADALSVNVGGQSLTLNEGLLLNAFQFTGQTANFTEGALTASLSGDLTLALSQQSAQFAVGNLADGLSYILDQNTIGLVGQTAVFSEGVLSQVAGYPLTAYTLTGAEGTLSDSLTFTLTAQQITSSEGAITALSGSNVANTFSSQAINSSEGALSLEVDEFPTAETISTVVGTITFTNEANFATFPSFAATIAQGNISVIVSQGPPGTGPPLFIPPQLGKPVTTRTFSFADMAIRAWGSEFRAPDHRIYQFSGGNYKDSTDMGETGIYRRP